MNIGLIYIKLHRRDEAETALRRSLELAPDNDLVWFNLGLLILQNGEMEEAFAAFHRVLELNPRHTGAYHMLLRFQKVKTYNDTMKAAEELYESKTLSDNDLAYLVFGLGKAWEDLGDYDKSFAYYAEGNRVRRKSWKYDLEDDRRDTENLIKLFSAELLDQRCRGRDGGEEFLFIVGMPRSGSTLLDQILSAHPKVVDTGETDVLRNVTSVIAWDESKQINLEKFLQATDEQLENAAESYRKTMCRYFGEAEKYTDKTLPNLWLIGVIRLIFPKARILHCSRGPLDNCFSIFSNDFEGFLFKYGYDLKELGAYYRLYLQMMDHWRKVLPKEYFYDISYEALVSAPDEEIRHLVEFCGLEWDDQCLKFHQSKRNVGTSSLSQVRQPIYKSSVERWKRYEKHLQPLIEALGDAVHIAE